jgi:hypothetical protein
MAIPEKLRQKMNVTEVYDYKFCGLSPIDDFYVIDLLV